MTSQFIFLLIKQKSWRKLNHLIGNFSKEQQNDFLNQHPSFFSALLHKEGEASFCKLIKQGWHQNHLFEDGLVLKKVVERNFESAMETCLLYPCEKFLAIQMAAQQGKWRAFNRLTSNIEAFSQEQNIDLISSIFKRWGYKQQSSPLSRLLILDWILEHESNLEKNSLLSNRISKNGGTNILISIRGGQKFTQSLKTFFQLINLNFLS